MTEDQFKKILTEAFAEQDKRLDTKFAHIDAKFAKIDDRFVKQFRYMQEQFGEIRADLDSKASAAQVDNLYQPVAC